MLAPRDVGLKVLDVYGVFLRKLRFLLQCNDVKLKTRWWFQIFLFSPGSMGK